MLLAEVGAHQIAFLHWDPQTVALHLDRLASVLVVEEADRQMHLAYLEAQAGQ
jgi:hypothetical protein